MPNTEYLSFSLMLISDTRYFFVLCETYISCFLQVSCGGNCVCRYLIDRGAKLDAVNNDGDLPVDVADGKKLKAFLSELMAKKGKYYKHFDSFFL